MKKKSQMEVLGLVIVVILMAVGMLLVVNRMINRPVLETRKSYLDQEIAANMLNSLLKTSTGNDCRGADFTELFQDCAAHHSGGGHIRCTAGNIPSCEYLVDVINNTIFKGTTMRWKIPFFLTAQVKDQDYPALEISYMNCSRDNVLCEGCLYNDYAPKLSPIPTDVGTLNIEFGICS